MTDIAYQRQSGTAILHTDRLVVRTDGKLFIHSSADGALVPVDEAQMAALKRHFGSGLGLAIDTVRDLK